MIRIKSPGRICLFGEHQDYLNYPLISMAISKYIYLQAERISEPKFLIDQQDIDISLELPLNNGELEYTSNRDYLISGYNQFIRRRCKFENLKSGVFGGTMFALLPNNEQLIKKAIEQAGGEGYIIETSNGVEKY